MVYSSWQRLLHFPTEQEILQQKEVIGVRLEYLCIYQHPAKLLVDDAQVRHRLDLWRFVGVALAVRLHHLEIRSLHRCLQRRVLWVVSKSVQGAGGTTATGLLSRMKRKITLDPSLSRRDLSAAPSTLPS